MSPANEGGLPQRLSWLAIHHLDQSVTKRGNERRSDGARETQAQKTSQGSKR